MKVQYKYRATANGKRKPGELVTFEGLVDASETAAPWQRILWWSWTSTRKGSRTSGSLTRYGAVKLMRPCPEIDAKRTEKNSASPPRVAILRASDTPSESGTREAVPVGRVNTKARDDSRRLAARSVHSVPHTSCNGFSLTLPTRIRADDSPRVGSHRAEEVPKDTRNTQVGNDDDMAAAPVCATCSEASCSSESTGDGLFARKLAATDGNDGDTVVRHGIAIRGFAAHDSQDAVESQQQIGDSNRTPSVQERPLGKALLFQDIRSFPEIVHIEESLRSSQCTTILLVDAKRDQNTSSSSKSPLTPTGGQNDVGGNLRSRKCGAICPRNSR